jgi:N-acetyl-beta-hexosaminidase
MYELLGSVYNEMFYLFDPDVFHFGGDEVKRPVL